MIWALRKLTGFSRASGIQSLARILILNTRRVITPAYLTNSIAAKPWDTKLGMPLATRLAKYSSGMALSPGLTAFLPPSRSEVRKEPPMPTLNGCESAPRTW
jgi:hypothetical protein